MKSGAFKLWVNCIQLVFSPCLERLLEDVDEVVEAPDADLLGLLRGVAAHKLTYLKRKL